MQFSCLIVRGAGDPKDSSSDSVAADWVTARCYTAIKSQVQSLIYFHSSNLAFEMEEYKTKNFKN